MPEPDTAQSSPAGTSDTRAPHRPARPDDATRATTTTDTEVDDATSSAHVQRRAKAVLREALSVLVLAAAWLVAFELRFEFRVPADFRTTSLVSLAPVVVLKYLLLWAFRAQRHSWRFTSLWDVVGVVAAMATATVLLVAFRFLIPPAAALTGIDVSAPVPLGVLAADLSLSILALTGLRATRRLQVEQQAVRARRDRRSGAPATRVVLIGAGQMGATVARELAGRPDLNLEVLGFLDDNRGIHGQRIGGLDVLGGLDLLSTLAEDERLEQAIITIADARGGPLRELSTRCRAVGVEPLIVPAVDDVVTGRIGPARPRPVSIEDLLGRDPVRLDTSQIASLVAGAAVVVTGAGGSIGAELCRQVLRFGPRRLVLVDQAEGALWAIHRELSGAGARTGTVEGVALVPAIADVGDAERIAALFAEHQPSLVFHAAAHKHVPMLEANPGEAVKNNVFGTKVVTEAALAAGVARFVLVSTDKAVNPSSVMGATKRIAERYVQHLARTSGAALTSVRFGNVLGSSGSVVPIFEEQIAAGGPVTVTHPEMRRYFMTIPEASALVVQAAAVGGAGDVMVLDMGDPVHIRDLAEDLIALSGLRPGVDIDVIYTGIRPGEKLFEELALDAEHTDATTHPSILLTRNDDTLWDDAEGDLERLWATMTAGDVVALRAAIAQLVPEMQPEARAEP